MKAGCSRGGRLSERRATNKPRNAVRIESVSYLVPEVARALASPLLPGSQASSRRRQHNTSTLRSVHSGTGLHTTSQNLKTSPHSHTQHCDQHGHGRNSESHRTIIIRDVSRDAVSHNMSRDVDCCALCTAAGAPRTPQTARIP